MKTQSLGRSQAAALAAGLALVALAIGNSRGLAGAGHASPTLQLPEPQPIPFTDSEILLPAVDLLIETIELDRSLYLVDMSWSATVRVSNVGGAPAPQVQVFGWMCRYVEGGTAFPCQSGEILIGSIAGLEPGTSVEFTTGPHPWDDLPLDPLPTEYQSDGVPGLPDAGLVALRSTVYLFAEGNPWPAGETRLDNNEALAVAVYPSGPANPGYDPLADPDGDGWTEAEGDCRPENPNVFPWHNEIVLNNEDDNCADGDGYPSPNCPDVYYHTSTEDPCGAPPGYEVPDTIPYIDNDHDGSRLQNDCDDFNGATQPSAEEIPDGVDNNCNSLIDEGHRIPDWRMVSFNLSRGWVDLVEGANWGYHIPGLRYEAVIENLGESLGPQELDYMDDLVVILDLEGTPFSTGAVGYIPYGSFSYGSGFQPGCDAFGLVAAVPGGGILGETQTGNNVLPASIPSVGTFDRDLRFASAPELFPWFGDPDHLGFEANEEAVGTCPPLITLGFENQPDLFFISYRIFAEGVTIYDEMYDRNYSYAAPLEERLRAGDWVCLEVELDPNRLVVETNETNNTYLQLFRFRNPLIGESHFELVDAYSDAPGWTCRSGEITAVGSAAGALSPGGGSGAASSLGGIGGALLIGGLAGGVGWMLRRRLQLGGLPGLSLVAGVTVMGALVGGIGGSALVTSLGRASRGPVSDLAPQALPSGPASCEAFLDAASAAPGDGARFRAGDSLLLDLGDSAVGPESLPFQFVVSIVGPSGAELLVPWTPSEGEPPVMDLVREAARQASPVFQERGEFRWQLLYGSWRTGANLNSPVTHCEGSAPHSFFIDLISQPVALTSTPATAASSATLTGTPTATATRAPSTSTPTATATAILDTSGPIIKSVSDSPDPIYVNQPAGCSPNTSIVSVSVSDPSGVASVVVLFFHTTIGAVPMTNTGGNNWQATLGPYAGVGDGTLDYQIRATDNHGNITESAFYQITVLACIP